MQSRRPHSSFTHIGRGPAESQMLRKHGVSPRGAGPNVSLTPPWPPPSRKEPAKKYTQTLLVNSTEGAERKTKGKQRPTPVESHKSQGHRRSPIEKKPQGIKENERKHVAHKRKRTQRRTNERQMKTSPKCVKIERGRDLCKAIARTRALRIGRRPREPKPRKV